MKKELGELKLWVLIAAIAAALIGVGIIVTLLLGNSAGDVFEKFLEANVVLILIAVILLLIGIAGLILYTRSHTAADAPLAAPASKGKWTIKELIVGALCIGLAFVLSYIRIFHLPQGGSITPASMLPICIFAYIYGTPKGLIVGIAFGILQVLQDAYVVHWAQLFLDYIFAFGALSLTGLFRKSLVAGVIASGLARTLFHFLSGFIFFAEYAPAGQSPVIYSLVYQASYMIPEIAICAIIAAIPAIRRTIEQLRAQALGTKTPVAAKAV